MLFLRFIKSKKLRLLLLIVSLALASGIYIGVSSGRDLARQSYIDSLTNSLGYTDFVVKGNQSYFFSYESFAGNLTENPYITEFEARVQMWCRASYLPDFSSYTYLYLTGVNQSIDSGFGQLNMVAGNSNITGNNTVISSLVADLLDLNVNDSIYIQLRTFTGKYVTLKLLITGIAKLDKKIIDFDKNNPERYWEVDRAIFVNLNTIQLILGAKMYTHVYVHVNDLQKIPDAFNLMNQTLVPTFSICNIKAKMLSDIKTTIENITKLIDVTYIMGFILSIFLLVDLLYQYLIEWKYYIGVLKSLGVTNTRIFMDLTTTVFAIAVISTFLGIPIAQLSFLLMMFFAEPLLGNLSVTPATFLIFNLSRIYEGFIITVILSVLICSTMLILFLKKHSIITLLGREKKIQFSSSYISRMVAVLFGLSLVVAGNYLLEHFLPNELSAENLNIAFVGLILMMIGLAISFTPPVISLPALITKYLKLSGKYTILATRNLKRNYWRTFFSIITIAFTISFIIGGFSIFNSFYGAIRTSSYLSIGADISIDGSMPVNITTRLLHVDGVEEVTGIKQCWRQKFSTHVRSVNRVNVYGINTSNFLDTVYEIKIDRSLNATINTKELITLLGKHNDSIILQKELLDYLNISVGDIITWSTKGGYLNLTVIGTVDLMAGAWETIWKDYSLESDIYMAIVSINTLFNIYKENTPDQQHVNRILVKTSLDSNATLTLQNIKAVLKENKVVPYRIRSVDEKINSLMKYYTPFFGLFQILMYSFVLLSTFSIITNFAYVALERRYELAILKCLGFSTIDFIKLIFIESIWETMLAGVLGTIIGVGVIMHLFDLLPFSSAFPLTYSLPAMTILTSILFASALAGLSSIVPTYHLLRGKLVEHLRSIE